MTRSNTPPRTTGPARDQTQSGPTGTVGPPESTPLGVDPGPKPALFVETLNRLPTLPSSGISLSKQLREADQ